MSKVNAELLQKNKKIFSFFGAAMFLRPSKIELRNQEQSNNIIELANCARKNPGNWDCLLMKRNYLDFSWDNIGGNNEFNEFPQQTMVREVFEEVGWEIQNSMEVCRQWKNGLLQGFLYLTIPKQIDYRNDSPTRVPCDEVQTIQYFNLLHILESNDFKPNVKGRVKAFIENQSDFSLQ